MSTEHESNTVNEGPATAIDTTESRRSTIDFGKAVGKIASMMQGDGLSTGDMAELRRISPDRPFTPALWRLLLTLELDESPEWLSQKTRERRWATLLMGMAHCAGLHDYHTSFGKALAEAGWSELRFVQLMRAKGQTLEKHLRRVAQFLSGKNQQANWVDVLWLLFSQSGEKGENIRLSISRSYYSALYAAEQA
jgi:CRISPR system Cascade subunit CasB